MDADLKPRQGRRGLWGLSCSTSTSRTADRAQGSSSSQGARLIQAKSASICVCGVREPTDRKDGEAGRRVQSKLHDGAERQTARLLANADCRQDAEPGRLRGAGAREEEGIMRCPPCRRTLLSGPSENMWRGKVHLAGSCHKRGTVGGDGRGAAGGGRQGGVGCCRRAAGGAHARRSCLARCTSFFASSAGEGRAAVRWCC